MELKNNISFTIMALISTSEIEKRVLSIYGYNDKVFKMENTSNQNSVKNNLTMS